MMAFLEFTFQSFWHFAGVLMLIYLPCWAAVAVASVIGRSIDGIGK